VHDAGNYLRAPEKTVRKVARRPGGWDRWRRAGGRVTIGHVPYALFREHLPADTRYVTFLREPIDRVLSHSTATSGSSVTTGTLVGASEDSLRLPRSRRRSRCDCQN
jgi:hypothetical protein